MTTSTVLDAEHAIDRQRQVPATPNSNGNVNVATKPVFHRQLFLASFVEPDAVERTRRKWTGAFSVTVQGLIVGFLCLMPLLFPDVLPVQQLVTFLTVPPPPSPPPPPPPATPVVRTVRVSEIVSGQLRVPSRIPEKIAMIKEEQAPASGGVEGGVVGGVPGGQLGGVIGSLVGSTSRPPALPPPPATVPQRIKISSGVSEGLLLSKRDPQYPILALRARVQGIVQLRAIISKQGNIENIEVVSGHPLLVPAAIDAVKTWRYRPYMLSGEPVEVDTTINVNFHMGQE